MARARGSRRDIFNQVAQNVCRECFTWERIALLLYVAGKLALKVGPELMLLVLVLVSLVGNTLPVNLKLAKGHLMLHKRTPRVYDSRCGGRPCRKLISRFRKSVHLKCILNVMSEDSWASVLLEVKSR